MKYQEQTCRRGASIRKKGESELAGSFRGTGQAGENSYFLSQYAKRGCWWFQKRGDRNVKQAYHIIRRLSAKLGPSMGGKRERAFDFQKQMSGMER